MMLTDWTSKTWGTQVALASKNQVTQLGLVSEALGTQQGMASKVQETPMGTASLAQGRQSGPASETLETLLGMVPKVQGRQPELVTLEMRLKVAPMFLGNESVSGVWD